MKGQILLLLCAIAVATGDIEGFYDNGCPKDTSLDKLLAHENCAQYYQCIHGALIARFCPSGLHFNSKREKCDWPGDVKCHSKREGRIHVTKRREHSEELDNGNPSHAHAICAATGSNGIFVAHENCNQFYKCSYGKPVALKCAKNLLFNLVHEKCDWSQTVDCGDRIIPFKDGKSEITENNISNANDEVEFGNLDPSQAPAICAKLGSDGVLVAHEICTQFYKCFAGHPVTLKCPDNLLYNANSEYCDWPRNVECGERVIPEGDNVDNGPGADGVNSENEGEDVSSGESADDTSSTGNSDPSQAYTICAARNSGGILVAHEKCNKFYKCSGGHPVALLCPANLLFNPSKDHCDWPRNVDCGDRIIPGSDDSGNDSNENDSGNNLPSGETGDINSDPSQAYSICAAPGSDGMMVAHENCNQFYKCHENNPVVLTCPANLLYNTYKEYCDWPTNVYCGDRTTPDKNDESEEIIDSGNGDESNGNNNSKPTKAPSICAGEHTDGMVYAHENCNQFYKCFGGKPVALFCQLNHLYNPNKEECDWIHNVDCNGRAVPGSKSSESISYETMNENPLSKSCSTTANGEILPHENCSQFYKCLHGQKYPMDCPPGLYFNPLIRVCDWPMNVDCGDRLTEAQVASKSAAHQSRKSSRNK